MNPKLISKEGTKAVYTAEIERQEFDKAKELVFQDVKKRANIPGFRKGKAPKAVIEANYGKDFFFSEALNKVLPEVIRKSVEELELDVIQTLDVEVLNEEETEKNLEIKVTSEIMPIPVLRDYSDLKVEKKDFSLKEEMIDEELKKQQEKNVVRVPREDGDTVENSDVVTMDYVGTVDGEAFAGGSAEGMKLQLGSGQFIPGFEEQVVGHKVGETFDILVTFPETYHAAELAGKEAKFNIKLVSSEKSEYPELDDDFAMDISEFDTLEAYKNDLRSKMTESLAKQEEEYYQNATIDALLEYLDVELPQTLVDREIDRKLQAFDKQVEGFGLTREAFLQYTGGTEADLMENMKSSAEKTVKVNFLGDALVEKENPQVSEEMLDEELKELAKQFNAKDFEDFKERAKKDGFVKNVERYLKHQEALKAVAKKAEKVEVEVSKEA